MDNTSFAPGASSKSNQPNMPLPELPPPVHHRHFPKFVTLIILLFLLGGTAVGSVWYWQNIQMIDEPVPAFTPRVIKNSATGEFCGGIAAFQCPSGYSCRLSGNFPDAGGVCVQEGMVCVQVITKAKNSTTEEIKDFPTPCDVPSGWQKI